jgi:hypothetical protein
MEEVGRNAWEGRFCVVWESVRCYGEKIRSRIQKILAKTIPRGKSNRTLQDDGNYRKREIP